MDVAAIERPAAARMRRSRDRIRNGLRNVSVDIRESEVEFLVRKAFLQSDARGDRGALIRALRQFLEDAFDRARRRGKLGSITVDLGPAAIDHLVRRGRSAPGERLDPDAVLRAFSEIVYEAFGRL